MPPEAVGIAGDAALGTRWGAQAVADLHAKGKMLTESPGPALGLTVVGGAPSAGSVADIFDALTQMNGGETVDWAGDYEAELTERWDEPEIA